MNYEYHELANLFPLMDESQYSDLVADIKENGLIESIILHEGKILDGRNRYNACNDAGVEPNFVEYEEIKNLYDNYPELWDRAKQIETNFKATSKIKNQRWIDNGRKLNKAGRANKGEWRENSWEKGARLYAKTVNGKQLSVEEWEVKFNQAEILAA